MPLKLLTVEGWQEFEASLADFKKSAEEVIKAKVEIEEALGIEDLPWPEIVDQIKAACAAKKAIADVLEKKDKDIDWDELTNEVADDHSTGAEALENLEKLTEAGAENWVDLAEATGLGPDEVRTLLDLCERSMGLRGSRLRYILYHGDPERALRSEVEAMSRAR